MSNHGSPADITSMTVSELQAALQDGATSADVTRAYLDRIAGTDGELGAYLHVDPEAALATAAELDAAAPDNPVFVTRAAAAARGPETAA